MKSNPAISTTTFAGRFYALDAFRGIAAVAVVCLHVENGLGGLPHPRSASLAVDLFFLLSGFVIAHAYNRRLLAGMTSSQFLLIRLIRLYPLYLLGLAIGVTKLLVQLRMGIDPPRSGIVMTDTVMGVLMLPSPTTIGRTFDATFPINLPAWSLFFELGINVVYAGLHRWLNARNLGLLVILSGLALAVVGWSYQSIDVGNYWHSLGAGMPRVAFSFFLGVLLHRSRLLLPRLGAGWFVLMIIVLAASLLTDPAENRLLYSLGCVVVLFPLLVATGQSVELSERLQRVCSLAGDTSYAVYIIHLTVLTLLLAIMKRMNFAYSESALAGPVFIVLLLIGCYFADRYYDAPVRRRLSRFFLRDGVSLKPAPLE